MLVLLNAYYLAYYFYRQWKLAEIKTALQPESAGNSINETKDSQETFLVHRGAQSIPLPVGTIAYFYREGDYNYLKTLEGDHFLVPETLDEVEKQLDANMFFRANRQVIVQHKSCSHFSELDFGKLELFVSPAAKEPIVISQRRAKSFKEWMQR
jgi:DNA-binding LytR/AlgR family response regulator